MNLLRVIPVSNIIEEKHDVTKKLELSAKRLSAVRATTKKKDSPAEHIKSRKIEASHQ